MRQTFLLSAVGLIGVVAGTSPAPAQIMSSFATPLPPGPGSVPMTLPASPMAAPVLMPLGAPTAAPVGVYHYPGPLSRGAGSVAVCDEGGECTQEGERARAWAYADFFYGASKGVWAPPLVTRSPAAVPLGLAGALYSPATTVLFGGERVGNDFRPGMRVGGGYWFDPARRHGVDSSLFFLSESGERFAAASGPGGVTIARPLVLGLNGLNVGLPVAGPFPGGVTVSADTFVLGSDVNYRHALTKAEAGGCGGCGGCGGSGRFDLLIGYRYMHLGDTVDVWQAGTPALPVVLLAPLVPLVPVGFVVHDSFHTRNHFHGPQVGLASSHDLHKCGLSLELLAKVALGVTVSEADVVGTGRVPGLPAVPGGVLVGPSNAGAYDDADFAVVPEAGARLAWRVCPQVRLTTGYSFVYWSSVRRAPSLIDLTVLAPGRPAVRDRTDDLWVQGWTIGAEWRY